MRKISKFFRLSNAERGLLMRAVVLVGTMRLGLWLVAFQRLIAWQTHAPAFLRADSRTPPEQVRWAVEVASRYLPGAATCLVRALAAQALLAGRDSHLRIGVSKGEHGRLAAHAWVESEGEIVIGGSAYDGFVALPALEGGRS